MRLGLLHSPFLTAGSWGELPAALASRGADVVVVSVTEDDTPPYVSSYAHAAAAQLVGPPIVLVAHSGAGPLLPVVAARRDWGGVLGAVYLDALLPGASGQSRLQLLAGLAPALGAALARDLYAGGTAPRWPAAEVEALAARGLALRPRGLDFFTEAVPVPTTGWTELPWAYLQTSPGYDGQAAVAEKQGRPVLRRGGGHLAALADPDGLADDLLGLVARPGLLGVAESG